MKTVPVGAFTPRISPLVNDCPNFAISRAVSDTVIQICKETLCLTTEVFMTTPECEPVCEIPMPEGLDAEIVRHAFCDGWEMHPMTLDQLSRHYAPLDYRALFGMPLYYCFQKRNMLTLCPTPEKRYAVKLVVGASIERDARNIPDLFFHDYADCVVDGALARIFKQAGQSWSNFGLAGEYEARFQNGLKQVLEDTTRDYTRTNGHVVYNHWIY